MYTMYDNMTKDTTTIRIKEDTKKMLETFGHFGDNYDDCIQRLYSEYITQQNDINRLNDKIKHIQKKQSKPKKQSKQNK